MNLNGKSYLTCANPYMPRWEHVPDGEPRVFEYNGEKRVYVYGSHDMLRTEYCGTDQVCWSAPVDDLTKWTCHGICYTAADGSVLFAPDVVQKGDTFYMYAAEARGSRVMVARSKNPAGPFTDPVLTELGFDPGVLVDDDGRVYAFWGFCKSYAAELNDDMATIKPGTLRENLIDHCDAPWAPQDGHINRVNGFFEASSPRKINGKYVLIYSKRTNTPDPNLGVFEDCNGYLSYFFSKSPLDGYVWGGDISFNGGEIIENTWDGAKHMTYRWGNNHGSIACIEGEWYVFYHRHTGTDEFSRQAMMEHIEVAESKYGRLFIGKVLRDAQGEPVASTPAEMTSMGPNIKGLDPRLIISAGYACHIYGSKLNAYIAPAYEQTDSVSTPVMNITDGTTVGFRYFNFGGKPPVRVYAKIDAMQELYVNVRADHYEGPVIATAHMNRGDHGFEAGIIDEILGWRAIYFEFISTAEGEVARFDFCTFE